MLKKLILPIIFATVAAYLFYSAYQQRSVATFLWAISFSLACLASTTSLLRDAVIVIISLTVTMALVETGLAYAPDLMGKKPDTGINTGKDKSVFAYFDSAQTYNTPAYWHLGEFGSQPQPGAFTAKKVASNGDVLYDTIFTIGKDGFRVTPKYDANLAPKTTSDKSSHRINFLGDSFTFGEGVADNETMSFYAGDLLNGDKVPSNLKAYTPLVVKNYGIHGWGIHQSLAVLQSQLDTKADVQVVLTAPWHASRVACADFFSLGSPKYQLEPSGEVKRDGYCRSFAWIEHSPKALRALITSSKIFNLIQDSLLVTTDQDKQIELYLGVLKTMALESKKRGERLVVGFIKADEAWFIGTYSNDKVLAKIKSMGIDTVDLTLAAKNEDLPRKYYIHELDKHPTAAANLERVHILLRHLEKP